MSISIIDYKAGNITSVLRAVRNLGHEDAAISADPAVIAAADRVIFPGVGAAGSCMANLRERGMDAALRDAVAAGTPVLGICIGMQLILDVSDEDGGVDCLGLVPGRVELIEPPDASYKVPHMGWNPVAFAADEPLAEGVPEGSCFYFVHSFRCVPAPGVQVIATTDHGVEICAGVRRDNLVAVQFHPEKSGEVGLRVLKNFLG